VVEVVPLSPRALSHLPLQKTQEVQLVYRQLLTVFKD
jgi:hypothetical protein